jgi:hypothetical protein
MKCTLVKVSHVEIQKNVWKDLWDTWKSLIYFLNLSWGCIFRSVIGIARPILMEVFHVK